jgi:glycosyltransferase involved in cell wall biosynthesis
VLWLIKGLGPGGAERLLALGARHCDRSHVRPTVAYLLAQRDALVPEIERTGVEVRCLGARASWDPTWMLRLRRLVTADPVDVVHIHSPLVAIGTRIVLRTLRRARRPRLVTTEHNVWASHTPATRLADRLTARRDEVHLAVSGAVRASMPERLQSRTRVVRYGIELGEVQAASWRRDAARTSLGLSPDDLCVGTVANLRATKGYPDLLTAAGDVGARVSGARFVAIGQGPLAAELRATHARLGLGARFRFLGYRPDAIELMSAFDVFCLASHHEGLPIALMEALALGLPVVATTAGGIPELVTDGREARLVPPGDPGRLADALVAVLEDPDGRAEMSRLARQRAEALNVVESIRRVESVYLEAVYGETGGR